MNDGKDYINKYSHIFAFLYDQLTVYNIVVYEIIIDLRHYE